LNTTPFIYKSPSPFVLIKPYGCSASFFYSMLGNFTSFGFGTATFMNWNFSISFSFPVVSFLSLYDKEVRPESDNSICCLLEPYLHLPPPTFLFFVLCQEPVFPWASRSTPSDRRQGRRPRAPPIAPLNLVNNIGIPSDLNKGGEWNTSGSPLCDTRRSCFFFNLTLYGTHRGFSRHLEFFV